MSDNVIEVNDSNYVEVVSQSELPVLLDFSATWCGPCKRQLPILETFAESNKERILICKLDIDDSPAITAMFGIKSVPSLVLIKNNKRLDTKVGLSNTAVIETLLTNNNI